MTCPICLEIYKEPTALNCGHVFCAKCLKLERNLFYTINCPVCRQGSNIKVRLYWGLVNEADVIQAMSKATDDFEESKKKMEIAYNKIKTGMNEHLRLKEEVAELQKNKALIKGEIEKEVLHSTKEKKDKLEKDVSILENRKDSLRSDIYYYEKKMIDCKDKYRRINSLQDDIKLKEDQLKILSCKFDRLQKNKKQAVKQLRDEVGREILEEYFFFKSASEKVFGKVNTSKNFIKIMEIIKALQESSENGRIKGVDLGTQKLIDILAEM